MMSFAKNDCHIRSDCAAFQGIFFPCVLASECVHCNLRRSMENDPRQQQISSIRLVSIVKKLIIHIILVDLTDTDRFFGRQNRYSSNRIRFIMANRNQYTNNSIM